MKSITISSRQVPRPAPCLTVRDDGVRRENGIRDTHNVVKGQVVGSGAGSTH